MRMFSQSTFSIYFLLMIFSLAGADLFDKTIKWVPVSQSEAVLLGVDPAGFEVGDHFFLCRVHHEGRNITGKLRFNNGVVDCLIGYADKAYKYGDFQVLLYPPETTSWIPITGSYLFQLPENAIISSIEGADKSFVCRAKFTALAIPGTFSDDGVCTVELWHKQGSETVSSSPDIEILVINMYGEKFGVTQELG